MNKPQLPQLPSINLKGIRVSRTVVIVSLVLLFILAITLVGAVQSVKRAQAISAENTKQEQLQASLVADNAKLKDENSKLTNQLMFERSAGDSKCDYIKSFSARYRLTLPPLCQPPKI